MSLEHVKHLRANLRVGANSKCMTNVARPKACKTASGTFQTDRLAPFHQDSLDEQYKCTFHLFARSINITVHFKSTLELRTYMKKNDRHTQVCLRISRFSFLAKY